MRCALTILLVLILGIWVVLKGGRWPAVRGRLQLVSRKWRTPALKIGNAGAKTRHGPAFTPDGEESRALALSLVEHGMPAYEVARRTGLSQDALAVLQIVQSRRGTFANPDTRPWQRSA